MTVTVYCRRSVNASVSVVGGNGGLGVDGFTIPDQIIWVDDTPDDLSDFAGHEELIPGRTVDGTPGGEEGEEATGGTAATAGRSPSRASSTTPSRRSTSAEVPAAQEARAGLQVSTER